MKIALVILHADPARGGAERYTIDLAAALVREGHEVWLLATSFADAAAGASCVQLDHRGATRAGRYDSFVASLNGHLDETSYDVVHAMLPVPRCDVYHPHAGLAAAAVAEGSRVSTLFNSRRSRFAQVERELLASNAPPVVLCLSEYVRANVRRYCAPGDARLPILFNAVDLSRFEPRVARRDDATIAALIVAQDFERKGLREAIEALARVHDRRLRLHVVGKQDTGAYERVASSRGVREQVIFHGPTRDARPHYATADFFVLPTKHDPCSLVVLEALAMGLPVISTRFNGACEIMTDGVHGYVLEDPNDVDVLAEAMRKMLDPARRAAMAHACLDLRPKLSYDNHLKTLLGIYRDVVRWKSTRGATTAESTAPTRA